MKWKEVESAIKAVEKTKKAVSFWSRWLSLNGSQAIRLYQAETGMNQSEVAVCLGVSRSHISHIISGRFELSIPLATKLIIRSKTR